MIDTAGAVVVLTSMGFGAQVPPTLGSVPVVGTHTPPFAPQAALVAQFVLHVPATTPVHDPASPPGQSESTLHAVLVPVHVPATTPAQEPAAPPGQVASVLQLGAAGPLKRPIGDFGDAHVEAT